MYETNEQEIRHCPLLTVQLSELIVLRKIWELQEEWKIQFGPLSKISYKHLIILCAINLQISHSHMKEMVGRLGKGTKLENRNYNGEGCCRQLENIFEIN